MTSYQPRNRPLTCLFDVPQPAPRPAPRPSPRHAARGPGMRVPARAQVSRENSLPPSQVCRDTLTLTLTLSIQVSRETFVDFCILCGCDYTGTIRGVGPMTAFKLLKQHGSIEAVAATLDSCKLPPAESWQVSASLAPLRLSRASAPLCAASPPLHLSASPPLHLSAAAPPRLSAPLHPLHPRRLCTPSSPHRPITQSFHRLLRLARRAPSSCSPRWWTWRASSCAGARPMCPGCAPSSCSDTPLTRRAPPRLSPPPP